MGDFQICPKCKGQSSTVELLGIVESVIIEIGDKPGFYVCPSCGGNVRVVTVLNEVELQPNEDAILCKWQYIGIG